MKKMVRILILFLAFAVMSGCISDAAYQRSAMRRARTYVLDEMRDLNENQLAYVRFSTPEWQATKMFAAAAMDKSSTWRTMNQINFDKGSQEFNTATVRGPNTVYGCFVWRLPGDEECIIVSGVSRPNMQGWEPLGAVRRPIAFGEPKKLAALNSVRSHIFQEMTVLSGLKEVNDTLRDRIRFSPPVVMRSAFLPDTPVRDGFEEYSFIWLAEPQTKCVTVSGYAPSDFAEFQIMITTIRPVHTLPDSPHIGNFTELRSEARPAQNGVKL